MAPFRAVATSHRVLFATKLYAKLTYKFYDRTTIKHPKLRTGVVQPGLGEAVLLDSVAQSAVIFVDRTLRLCPKKLFSQVSQSSHLKIPITVSVIHIL